MGDVNPSRINRRQCIQLMGAGTAAFLVPFPAGFAAAAKTPALWPDFDLIGPVDRGLADQAARAFSGDYEPTAAHAVLWDTEKYVKSLGGLPPVDEKADVVIVGGGISGLLSAYLLRRHKPILLERAPRFGGNSRGESWGGLDYPLGASYISPPEKGSPVAKYLKEIGLEGKVKVYTGDDPVFIEGKKYSEIWKNGTSAENKNQFVKLKKILADIANEKNGRFYPEIPIAKEKNRKRTEALDARTFKDWAEAELGGPLHPHLEAVLDYYFWSSAAASISEISAAQGLNFLAADVTQGMAVPPGGNSSIAEYTLKGIAKDVPRANLRQSSTVFDVRVEDGGARVSYVDSSGKAKVIKTRYVVMSCPKFIVGKILHDIESERAEAFKKLKYRSYLVANILVKHHFKDPFYDIYFLKEAAIKEKTPEKRSRAQMITDVAYSNLAQTDAKRLVLTAYRPIPHDNIRKELYEADFYSKCRAQFEKQIFEEFLPGFGVEKKNVVDIRLTRWGHPLPLAEHGLISDKIVDKLRKPFKDRVYFVEQDNWMLPAFEVAFAEAKHWAREIERKIKA